MYGSATCHQKATSKSSQSQVLRKDVSDWSKRISEVMAESAMSNPKRCAKFVDFTHTLP